MPMSPLRASLLVVVSACSFGAMAIFGRFAYAAGVDVFGVLLPRFVIASLVLWLLMRLTGRRAPPRDRLPGLLLMGAGYVGQSLCYFFALNWLPAGMVALLLYLFPLFVLLLSRLLGHESLNARKIAALVLCSAGILLTIGIADAGAAKLDPRGIALGVGAALIYSVYIVAGSRITAGIDPMASTSVILTGSAAGLALIVVVRWMLGMQVALPSSAQGVAAVLAIALVSTVIAVACFVAGLRQLGSSKAALLSTLEPVVTVGLAAVFLGEALRATQLAGGALVLGGALLLASAPSASASTSMKEGPA
jgi:drug/metabolite transporter (DMT)-like permease